MWIWKNIRFCIKISHNVKFKLGNLNEYSYDGNFNVIWYFCTETLCF